VKPIINNSNVSIASANYEITYPQESPYHPGEEFPELLNNCNISENGNEVYSLFREILFLLGLDKENFGSQKWNPLGDIIEPGQNVLIKPNFVRHLHMAGGDLNSVITHGSVIRCALDYVALALNGSGSITVGDAPIQSAEFDKIIAHVNLNEICKNFTNNWGMEVNIVDFRLASIKIDKNHRVLEENSLEGDTNGYCSVDLGQHSLLAELGADSSKFRVTSYNCDELKNHHNEKINEYLIPQTVLNADVVINLPKLKTHRKVGITAALKNLVGINGFKDWLPHHRCGSLKEGGDEYKIPSVLKRMRALLSEQKLSQTKLEFNPVRTFAIRVINRLVKTIDNNSYEEGSWYGNDTIWRTVLDLNRLLIYSDKNGKLQNENQRYILTIVDGIIAGEGEGPMQPDAKNCGVLVGGVNPVAIDTVISKFIGFDYKKISLLKNAFNETEWPLVNFKPDDIRIRYGIDHAVGQPITSFKKRYDFTPPSGWYKHIEYSENQSN